MQYSVILAPEEHDGDNLDHYDHMEVQRLSERIQQRGDSCMANMFPDVVGLRMLWRPSGERSVHDKKDHKRIIKLIQDCSLPLDDDFLKARPQPRLYDFEKRYLSQPPLWYTDLSSSSKMSKVYIVNDTGQLSVGDTLYVRVDVFSHKGEIMSRGGDEVRVWFVDVEKETRFDADVTDLNNGSYLASQRLPSAGNFHVKASLAHTSDFLGAVVRLHLLFKSLLWNVGLFKRVNGTESESTPCSHQPHLPFYAMDELCNLTLVNGFPWFCGRPVTSGLSCEQYLGTKNIQHIEGWRLPVSDAQLTELERTNQEPKIRLIETFDGASHVTVTAAKETSESRKRPCNKVPGRQTWTRTSSGYFQNQTWVPYSCDVPDADTVSPQNCLKNVPIYMFADSNGRAMQWHICDDLMNATEVFGTFGHTGWHKPIKCVNSQLNFSSLWRAHSSPWCHSQTMWAILMNPGDLESERTTDPLFSDAPDGIVNQLNPSPAFIDALPSAGRMLVILHHYFHFTMHHFSGYHNMVILLRDAVKRLVARNPDALVMVRGPHAAYEGWPGAHYVGGDMLGRFFEEVLVEEFRDVSDRVFYIRNWDMTVAVENYDVHPPEFVQEAIVKMMLNYACGR